MGTRLFKVSDISGQVVEEETQLTRLIVEEHPNFSESIGLEVLPEEIESQLPEQQEYVAFSYTFAGATEPQRFVLPLEEFNRLFPNANGDAILQRVHQEQQQAQEIAAKQGRGRRQPTGTRPRVDYSSAAHAGEPHRGTISEAEKEYVRNNLAEVNARLRANDQREIDPNDPEMAERYGLTPPPTR